MATYTVTNVQIGAHAKVLGAGVVDTVTFVQGGDHTVPGWNRLPKKVEVLSDAVADIYFTVDGTTPTVGGANCYRVPAGALSVDVAPIAGEVVVKLISSGAPTYSVSKAG